MRFAPFFGAAVVGAMLAGCAAAPAGADRPRGDAVPRIISVHVDKAPALDGKAGDDTWAKAKPVEITVRRALPPNVGTSATVTVRSVHTDGEVFFLVAWDDADESVSHKTWVWNADKKAYEEGKDREDMFALAFELSGTFNPDMLSGDEAVWDVWHWKAFRTNPHGYAMDKTHRYTREKPEGKAKQYPARNGTMIWIARPEDSGDTVEKSQKAPTEFQGDRFRQYVAGTPSGSAADVRAKGSWANGKWTLELGRKLTTGHKDDTQFDTGKVYKMGISTFDKTGDMDKGSGLVELSFSR